MFEKNIFRLLIEKTLKSIGLYSKDAVELLLGTCAQESAFGKYNRQLGGGPALGVFQMEPATFNDIVDNFLKYKKELYKTILEVSGVDEYKAEYLVDNNIFSICMARVHYLRVKEKLPNTVEGYANYWKKYYNTVLGKGKVSEFIRNYDKYVV